MHILNIFNFVADILNKILFFNIFNIPLLILFFIFAGLYFTIALGFPNIKMFAHGLKVAIKNEYSKEDKGEITPRQAFFASASSIVGLGNIAGVAVAISVGGPGSVIWMLIMAFFGMSTVFAEVILGHKYRYIDRQGVVNGGPFRYLKQGLSGLGYKKLGISLSVIFALLSTLSGIGGSAIFQTHEAIESLTELSFLQNKEFILSIIFTTFTGFVIIGGIKRLSRVMDKVVPAMTIIYIVSCIIILIFNFQNLLPAFQIMFKDAFAIKTIRAGFLGTIITGLQRSSFSNEAGLGSAPISYSTMKTNESVKSASVACLNPFLDTMIVCLMTGLVIIVSGVYKLPDAGDGIVLTRNAFATVSNWFPLMLTTATVLFAISTLMGSGYGSQTSWIFLFGKKSVHLFNIIYCLAVFYAHQFDFTSMIKIADTFVLAIAIPNIIGLFLLRKVVKKEYKSYLNKIKIKKNV